MCLHSLSWTHTPVLLLFLPVLLGMKASYCLSIDVGSVKPIPRCPSVRPWLGFSWNLCFCLVNWPQALHTESVRFKSYGYSILLSLRTTDLQLDKILSETPKDIAQIVPVTPSGDPISIPWPAISLNLLDVLTVAKGNLVVTTDHECVHHCCCTLW